MKTVDYDGKHLLVCFRDTEKKIFYELLKIVKGMSGADFNRTLYVWKVFPTNKNLISLKFHGFGFSKNAKALKDSIDEGRKKDVEIKVSNSRIYIDCDEYILSKLIERFVYDDPKYCFVRIEGKMKFDASKMIRRSMIRVLKNAVCMDIGLLEDFISFIHEEIDPYFCSVEDEREKFKLDYSDDEISGVLSYLQLEEYQVEAVKKSIGIQNGIVKLPPGTGKTEIFLALCKILNKKTLILFNKITLVHQTFKRALNAGLDASIVQGSKADENHKIVMATVQSGKKIKGKYEVVIVDECHKASSPSFQKILKNKSMIFRLGFSATPFGKDEHKNFLVKRWLGNIIYTKPTEVMVDMKRIVDPNIYFVKIEKPTDIYKYEWVEAENEGIVYNNYRNRKIQKICQRYDDGVLILVKKILHGSLLRLLIPESVFISGDTPPEMRTECIEKFEKGEIKILIASTICDEGINIINIKSLIIAGGGVDFKTTIQRLGRGLRIGKDKKEVDAWDFLDLTNKILEKHSNERRKDYKREGFQNIQIIDGSHL